MEPGSYATLDGAKDNEGLLGVGANRNLVAHSPLTSLPAAAPTLMPAVNYAPLDLPGSAEPPKQCHPCPGVPQGASPAPVPYGYFGGGYYSCRVSRSSLKSCAQAATLTAYPAETPSAGEEYPSRPTEFAFYPGYPGSYQPMASYLDVSVVQTLGAPGEPRHEALLPMDSYQPWALTGGWNSQMCCQGEQNPPGPFWKATFTGNLLHYSGSPWCQSWGCRPPGTCLGGGGGRLGAGEGDLVLLFGVRTLMEGPNSWRSLVEPPYPTICEVPELSAICSQRAIRPLHLPGRPCGQPFCMSVFGAQCVPTQQVSV